MKTIRLSYGWSLLMDPPIDTIRLSQLLLFHKELLSVWPTVIQEVIRATPAETGSLINDYTFSNPFFLKHTMLFPLLIYYGITLHVI